MESPKIGLAHHVVNNQTAYRYGASLALLSSLDCAAEAL